MREALIVALLAALVVLYFRMRRDLARVQRQLELKDRETESWRREHDQAEARNRASQEALFNSMMEGVLVLDANQRVRMINQTIQELFGLTGDIYGQSIMEAFRQNGLQTLVQRAASTDAATEMELSLPGPPPRVLQASARVFRDPQGKPEGTIVVMHDLTRLKQLENMRQEFVANVSHELRTPLSMIKGYVETLLEGAKDDAESSTRFLGIIQKHTNRLTFLIEDLLTLSQLDSGRLQFRFQPVILRPVVESVLEDLDLPASKRKISLQNRVPAELTAEADGERLQQILYNLVDNAIKYGRTHGQVTIAAHALDTGMIEVSVQDNGPGLPADALSRVFERFYRVDRARSRDQGGTGLGLAIVKHLVQSHTGHVWVKSTLGQGATFYFTLPAANAVPGESASQTRETGTSSCEH